MTQRRLHQLSASLVAALAVAACVPPASPRVAPASARVAPDSLPAAFDARTFELRAKWSGAGGTSTDEWVRLERQGDGYTFTGTAEMSVYEAGNRLHAGPLAVTIPDTAMRAFLAALAAVPRVRGSYSTIRTHTDDYPDFTVTLRSDAGVVEIFSDSQSDRNWRVTIGGERFVSDSPAAFQAQDHIKNFYREAELVQILRAAGWGRE
jgi:hypothetical protein